METENHQAPSAQPPSATIDAAIESSLAEVAEHVRAVLASIVPDGLRSQLEEDVSKYTHFINALSRLAEATLKRELLKMRLLEMARQNQPRPEREGGITPETLKRIHEELDLL